MHDDEILIGSLMEKRWLTLEPAADRLHEIDDMRARMHCVACA